MEQCRFYSNVNVGFFFCPQAFRYLREEVKMFQGKPIMVSTGIDFIEYSKFLARAGSLLIIGCNLDTSVEPGEPCVTQD